MTLFGSTDNEKEKKLCTIVPENTDSQSTAASFFKVLAIIAWIGGLIIAILSSNTTVLNRYGYAEDSFSIVNFLSVGIIYAIAGGVLYCLAELFQNINTIAVALQKMKVIPDEKLYEVLQEKRNRTEADQAEQTNTYDAKTVSGSKSEPRSSESIDEVAVAQNEKPKSGYKVISEYTVQCCKCGCQQRAGRTICFQCGARFDSEEKDEE